MGKKLLPIILLLCCSIGTINAKCVTVSLNTDGIVKSVSISYVTK